MYFIPVNPTKDEIKAWLKEFEHTRDWLGEQCGNIEKRTVDNWLSSPKNIPTGTLALIARLIEDDRAAEATRKQKLDPNNQIFSLEVDLETFRQYSRAALAAGLTLEDWAITECDKAAAAWQKSQKNDKTA